MRIHRKAFALLGLPFGAVSLLTFGLFFISDQTMASLYEARHMREVWLESDRGAADQIRRCLQAGGSECDLARIEQALNRPLAYAKALAERAKPHPDNAIMLKALREATVRTPVWQFRLRWYDRIAPIAGLNADDRVGNQG